MTVETEALDVLRSARDKVAAGWCQGLSFDVETNSYCASGAISQSASIYRALAATAARTLLTNQINANYPGKCCLDGLPFLSIPHWNDHIATSQDEVLAMFDKAIAQVEESL